MDKSRTAICVYGASSSDIPEIYLKSAKAVGTEIAKRGFTLINGGGRSGIMAATIEGAVEAGGEAIGIIPRFMYDRNWNHPMLSRVIVTETMHSRKELMASMSYGAIALPGGIGTLEELMEIITWRKLKLFPGNAVIGNINGFFDPMLQMLGKTISEGFMHDDHAGLWTVAENPNQCVEMAAAPNPRTDFSETVS